ncbi:MAG: flagellar export chaperone FlgN [Desulfamplus sp.]|nr:flagellar export chaperone FlgN [Desulfamplus sp.]
MEKITSEMENILHEKLDLYKELIKILEMEATFIVNMDMKSLWAASSRKKELLGAVEKVRQNILSLLDNHGIDHTMESTTFSLAKIVEILPVDAKSRAGLETLKVSMDIAKRDAAQLARGNRRNIQEYLGVIDGVISTVTGASREKTYGSRGISGNAQSFYGTRMARGVSTSFISAQV